VTERVWAVEITDPARDDFEEIIEQTADRFGPEQARIYVDVIWRAVRELRAGPTVLGAKSRKEVGKDHYTLHVGRHGRRGRHFILFKVRMTAPSPTIEVLRFLHDAMDLRRHVPRQND